jgi:CrcB protein
MGILERTGEPGGMSSILIDILLVALGGCLGGMGRFWVSGVIARRYGETFPWGTLVVNVSGAACIGALAGLLLARDTHAAGQVPLWAGLVIGVLGSYTTVSSFSLQTLALVRSGEPLRAALNIVGSVALCLSAATAGYAAAIAATAGM